jgi:hypothetical protein
VRIWCTKKRVADLFTCGYRPALPERCQRWKSCSTLHEDDVGKGKGGCPAADKLARRMKETAAYQSATESNTRIPRGFAAACGLFRLRDCVLRELWTTGHSIAR